MVTIEDAQDILDEVAEGLPQEFYKELNGGISLLPDVRKSREPWADSLYILGQYAHTQSMGRYIEIYFGSFLQVFGEDVSREKLAKELRKTLLHEFTHHLESLAGENALEKEDERQLWRYKNRARRIRRIKPPK